MILHGGVYQFLSKRTGFRNDFCRTCGCARRSYRVRSLYVWHVFWVPVVPIGFWSRWYCAACGRPPGFPKSLRPLGEIVGAILLAPVALTFWVVPVKVGQEALFWALRMVVPLVALALLAHALNTPRGPSRRRHLASIAPANDLTCPLCHVALSIASGWRCPRCGMQRC